MKSEYVIGFQAVGAMAGLTGSTCLYMLGGRSNKWLRRYLSSLVLAVTVNAIFFLRHSWSPWFLLVWPLLIGGFSLGYGGDSLGYKILRRSLYALGVCLSGILICLVVGGNSWWLLIPHVGIGAWSVYFGTKNIIPAAAEEVLVCSVLSLILVFYPFVV